MTDPAGAETAGDHWSRRALVAAGVVGATALVSGARPAAAGAAPISADDSSLATFAIGIELAARDLYRAAVDAGAEGTAWGILVTQHSSYAERIAGIVGQSANTVDTALFDERQADFTGDRPANAAFDLENTLIATHVELIGMVTDTRLADALASIVSIESRHAAYLAERSGRGDDFDALFGNSATAIPAVAQ